MSEIPYIPENAPFSAEQRAWINGYLAGALSRPAASPTASPSKSNAAFELEPLLILFGSQTGSAEGLARTMAREAAGYGFAARAMDMNDYTTVDFSKESRLAIVTSTWGEGDPPDNAVAFWEFLNSGNAPRLDHVRFSVLALGDSNYADFCGAGKKFDEKIEQLGGRRIHPRADCDADFDEPAAEWMKGFWSAMKKTLDGERTEKEPSRVSVETVSTQNSDHAKSNGQAAVSFSRKHPFPARLLTNQKLNLDGSAKDTRHFEISLLKSGLQYEVGDALGAVPANCPELVNDLLDVLGFDGEEAVLNPQGQETSLRYALLHDYQITQPQKKFLQAIVERLPDSHLKELLKPESKGELEKHLWGREIIDLILDHPSLSLTPGEFVSCLGKLQPRLYSIASSPKAHPEEVHLTVAVVRYESFGRGRKGVCSTFLAERVEASTPVPVFIQPSHGFRLPADGDAPIIMVGPGTGIAPFRAFLQERRETGARGANWLFFGEQRAATDFLYRDEFLAMKNDGILNRLDTAFSRDQKEKIYVQHRMIEHANELWKWLDRGAHFYVCGDAKRMAKDVDAALHRVIETAGGKSPEQAAEYVNQMKQEKRYARDVY